MNKLLTYAGQQPVYLGDIDFMQDASKNVFTYLARALMSSGSDSLNAILQGVNISIDTSGGAVVFSWTSGVVVIAGEILPIAAGSVTGTASSILYFHVNSVKSGARTFKDGVSRSCWDTRTAIISTDSAGGTRVDEVPRMSGESSSDDAIYEGTPGTQYVTSARLIKRSGLWLCDVSITIPDEQSMGNLLSIGFSNMPQAHLEQLALQSCYLPIAMRVNKSVGETTVGPYLEIIPITLAFSNILQGDNISMFLSFDEDVNATTVEGTAKLQSLIPIF